MTEPRLRLRAAIGVWLLCAVARNAGAVEAAGGEVTETNGYRIHRFTATGNTNLSVSFGGTVDVLVVAGGGGGRRNLRRGRGRGRADLLTGASAVATVTGGTGGSCWDPQGLPGDSGSDGSFDDAAGTFPFFRRTIGTVLLVW